MDGYVPLAEEEARGAIYANKGPKNESQTVIEYHDNGLITQTVKTDYGEIEAASYITAAGSNSILMAPRNADGQRSQFDVANDSSDGFFGQEADLRSGHHAPSLARASNIPIARDAVDWRVTIPKMSRHWMKCVTKGWLYILAFWGILITLATILGPGLYDTLTSYNPGSVDMDETQSNILLEKYFNERTNPNFMFATVWAPEGYEIRQAAIENVFKRYNESLKAYTPKGIFRKLESTYDYKGFSMSTLAAEYIGSLGNSMLVRVLLESDATGSNARVASSLPPSEEVLDFQVFAREELARLLKDPLDMYPPYDPDDDPFFSSTCEHCNTVLDVSLATNELQPRALIELSPNITEGDNAILSEAYERRRFRERHRRRIANWERRNVQSQRRQSNKDRNMRVILSMPMAIENDLKLYSSMIKDLRKSGSTMSPLSFEDGRFFDLFSLAERIVKNGEESVHAHQYRFSSQVLSEEVCGETLESPAQSQLYVCRNLVKTYLELPQLSSLADLSSNKEASVFTFRGSKDLERAIDETMNDLMMIKRDTDIASEDPLSYINQFVLNVDIAQDPSPNQLNIRRALRNSVYLTKVEVDSPILTTPIVLDDDDEGFVKTHVYSRITSTGLLHYDTRAKQRQEGWNIHGPITLLAAILQALFLDNIRPMPFTIFTCVSSVMTSFMFSRFIHGGNTPAPIFGPTWIIALGSATAFHISTLFFWRLSLELKRARGMHFVHDALLVVLARIGKPILVTSFFSCVSFATLAVHPSIFSSGGALLAIMVIISVTLCHLTLLPALVIALPYYFARPSSFFWPCRLYCRRNCCARNCSRLCGSCQSLCNTTLGDSSEHDRDNVRKQFKKHNGKSEDLKKRRRSPYVAEPCGAISVDPFMGERKKLKETSEWLTQLKNPYLVYYNAANTVVDPYAKSQESDSNYTRNELSKSKSGSKMASSHQFGASVDSVAGFSSAFADPTLHAKVPDPDRLRRHAARHQQQLTEQQLQLSQAIQDPNRIYIPEGGGSDEHGLYDADGWYYYYIDVEVDVSESLSAPTNLFVSGSHQSGSTSKKVRMYFYYESDDPRDLPSHPERIASEKALEKAEEAVPQHHDASLATAKEDVQERLKKELVLYATDFNEEEFYDYDEENSADGAAATTAETNDESSEESNDLAGYPCCGNMFLCLLTRKRCLKVSTGYTHCFEDVYQSCLLRWYQASLHRAKRARQKEILERRKQELKEPNVDLPQTSPTPLSSKPDSSVNLSSMIVNQSTDYQQLVDEKPSDVRWSINSEIPTNEDELDADIAAAYADAMPEPPSRRRRNQNISKRKGHRKSIARSTLERALKSDADDGDEVPLTSPIIQQGREKYQLTRNNDGQFIVRSNDALLGSFESGFNARTDSQRNLLNATSIEEEAASETFISFNPGSSAPVAFFRRFMRCYWCKCCHPSEEDLKDDIGRQLAFQSSIDDNDDEMYGEELASAAIHAVYTDATLSSFTQPQVNGSASYQHVDADEQATVATALMMQQLGLLDQPEPTIESDHITTSPHTDYVVTNGNSDEYNSAANVSDSLIGLDASLNPATSSVELRLALARHSIRKGGSSNSKSVEFDLEEEKEKAGSASSHSKKAIENEKEKDQNGRVSLSMPLPPSSSQSVQSRDRTQNVSLTIDDNDHDRAPLLAPAPHLLATRYDPVNCFNYYRYLIADRDREEGAEVAFLQALDTQLGVSQKELEQQAEDDVALDSIDFEQGLGLGSGGDVGHRLAGVKLSAAEEVMAIARVEASKAAAAAAEARGQNPALTRPTPKSSHSNGSALGMYVAENATMMLHNAARPKTLTSMEVQAARYRQSTSLWYRIARMVTNRNFAFPFILLFLAVTGPVALHSHLLQTTSNNWLIYSRQIESRTDLRAMDPIFPMSTVFPNYIVQTSSVDFMSSERYFEFCYILANKLLEEGVVHILDLESTCFVTKRFISFDLSRKYLNSETPEYKTAPAVTYREKYRQYTSEDGTAALTVLRPVLDTFSHEQVNWIAATRRAIDRTQHILRIHPLSLIAGGNSVEIGASRQLGEGFGAQIIILVIAACVLALFFAKSLFAPVKVLVTSTLCLCWVAGLSNIVFQEGLAKSFLPTMDHLLRIHWFIAPLVISTTFALSFQFEFIFHLHTLEFRKLGYSNRVAALKSIYNMGGLLVVTSLIMCSFYGGLMASSQGILNQLGFVTISAVLLDVIFVTLLLSPALKSLAGEMVWWPLRLGPPIMDSNAFAELEPFDPSTKVIKKQKVGKTSANMSHDNPSSNSGPMTPMKSKSKSSPSSYIDRFSLKSESSSQHHHLGLAASTLTQQPNLMEGNSNLDLNLENDDHHLPAQFQKMMATSNYYQDHDDMMY